MPEWEISCRRLIWMRMLVSASAAAAFSIGPACQPVRPASAISSMTLFPRDALVAGDEHVALDPHVLLEQVGGDVLERRDDHDVVPEEVLRPLAGGALRRELDRAHPGRARAGR